MSKGRDFRQPRRRGFDDDNFSPRGLGGPPPRPSMAPRAPAASGPIIDATVKWFNPDKGFGFVELGDGSGDAFLHVAVLEAAGHKSVPPGASLRVRAGQGQKGPQVAEVLEVDETTAVEQPRRPRTASPRSPGGPGGPGGGAGGFGRRPGPDLSSAIELSGTVKWYNPEKGFGFVSVGDGGKDVFVHASVLQRAGLSDLTEGQRVTMQVVEGMKGREAGGISLG